MYFIATCTMSTETENIWHKGIVIINITTNAIIKKALARMVQNKQLPVKTISVFCNSFNSYVAGARYYFAYFQVNDLEETNRPRLFKGWNFFSKKRFTVLVKYCSNFTRKKQLKFFSVTL